MLPDKSPQHECYNDQESDTKIAYKSKYTASRHEICLGSTTLAVVCAASRVLGVSISILGQTLSYNSRSLS